MAISVGDALLKLGVDSSELDKDMKKAVDKIKGDMRTFGLALTAIGASITGTLALATKSAMEVESTKTAFENLAKSNRQSADEILSAMKDASKGTIAASDLMLSANRAMVLGVATNTEQFKTLMEIARDRARAMGLTVTQAFDNIVTGIGRGSPLILDNLGLVIDAAKANEVYAKSLGKTADQLTEAEKQQALLNEVLKQGQSSIDKSAQATMTTSEIFQALKASIGDLVAAIGKNLLPTIKNLFNTIKPLIDGLIKWMKAHPDLAKNIVILTGVLGGLFSIIGPLLLALPALGAAFHAALGPVGLVTLAITALIVAGTALYLNWDKVTKFFKDSWTNIKLFFLEGVKSNLESLSMLTRFIPGLNRAVEEAKARIQGMIDAEKVGRDARAMTSTIKSELEKQKQAELDFLAVKKGIAANELALARKNHDAKIDLLQKEYDEKIKTLNAETDYAVKAIQDQIDAIDAQTDAEELAITRAEEQRRLAELEGAYLSAETAEEKAAAKKAYEEYGTQVARNEILRQRDAEKDALRDAMDDLRTRAEAEAGRLEKELEANKTHENNLLTLAEEHEKNVAAALGREEEMLTASFETRLTDAAVYQAALEATLKDVNQTVTVTTVNRTESESFAGNAYEAPRGQVQYFAQGGMITEPTLLSRLSDMRPYAIAGERGPERVAPVAAGYQTANIYIQLDGRTLAQVVGQPLVDLIRVKTGVRI
ncbi:MAG: hypothetical protein PHU08_00280 [Dehalococcoidales bacterium]|nr:hypothetical protein [Dehalococcoidales bacterium]